MCSCTQPSQMCKGGRIEAGSTLGACQRWGLVPREGCRAWAIKGGSKVLDGLHGSHVLDCACRSEPTLRKACRLAEGTLSRPLAKACQQSTSVWCSAPASSSSRACSRLPASPGPAWHELSAGQWRHRCVLDSLACTGVVRQAGWEPKLACTGCFALSSDKHGEQGTVG